MTSTHPNNQKPSIVIGLGKTGFSMVRYLLGQGESVMVMDTRKKPPFLEAMGQEFPAVPLLLGSLDLPQLLQAKRILISPGVSLRTPELLSCAANKIPIYGDIELFAREFEVPIIAITGTNAKSTVTLLVGEMCKAAGLNTVVAGNIGTPILDAMAEQNGKPDVCVMELSSFQCETLRHLKPKVACVLNITADHLDRYTDISAYAAAKHQIYPGCELGVYNRDDPMTFPRDHHDLNHHFTFGRSQPTTGEFGLIKNNGQTFLGFGDAAWFPVNDLTLMGEHNWENALAAFAIGHAFGLPKAPMIEALKSFKGLPHRCQFVRTVSGVDWFDDSKGTNVGATVAAIEGLGQAQKGKLILIAGGQGKDAEFVDLANPVKQYVRHAILLGEDAPKIEQVLNGLVPITQANSLHLAVEQAQALAKTGDGVLLSPACASFDMFADYIHRGEQYCAFVNALEGKAK